ncbi:MAG: hypothetical protein HQL68_10865, partial [Magnetococcales bacterium]|nr:hypothetical protein [Magnetococcales bacterium]
MIPCLKMDTQEDIDGLIDIIDKMIDWWSEEALDHERIGECIERVGMVTFLEAAGLETTVDMVAHPRDNPYFKADHDHQPEIKSIA